MSVDLDVQYAVSKDDDKPPGPDVLRAWVSTVLKGLRNDAELTIRIVSIEEIRQLNRTYRHIDKPTNVLSFPFEGVAGVDLPLLGDVVICAAVVAQEAQEQNKPLLNHWAHIVVHGVLHLLGYDHVDEPGAECMEGLEIKILQGMGIANPYEDDCSHAAE